LGATTESIPVGRAVLKLLRTASYRRTSPFVEASTFMTEVYDKAAIRHFVDAELLAAQYRFDGAGHLIGFAVECAIKFALGAVNPKGPMAYVHLPDLVKIARKRISGRRWSDLHSLLHTPAFMKDWEVSHRYADDGYVSEAQFRAWRADAMRALRNVGLRKK
jgi:hypothetical protein